MYLDGRTRGRRVYWDGSCDGKTIKRLWVEPDGCKHCPHADRMRLRRVPKWLAIFAEDAGLRHLEMAYIKWRLARRVTARTHRYY